MHYKELDSPPELQKYVDWAKVKSWLSPASPNIMAENSSWRPEGFKLIDVTTNRLVTPPESCEYFVLSYVFGNVNVKQSNSNEINPDDLPATIRDAIIACVRLGGQYLWIDQLCIDQSDQQDLQEQIDCMGSIYEHASCTLVALAGTNSLYGLPGVTSPRIWNHLRLEIGDVVLAEKRPSLEECLSKSTWSTRGWTFQEAIFSSQLLFFTDYGVYYVSNKGWGTGGWSESSPEPSECFNLPKVNDVLEAHRMYSRRNLTKGSDAIRAFTGVLQKAYGSAIHYGLPINHIDQAMCWIADSAYWNDTEESSRSNFPSWSWASHNGIIKHNEVKAGLAVWAIPGRGDEAEITICTPAKDINWGNNYPIKDWGNGHLMIDRGHIAWSMILCGLEGCIPRKLPFEISLSSPVNEYQEVLKRWPTYDAFWRDAYEGSDSLHYFPGRDRRIAASNPGSILVYTQTACFFLDTSLSSEQSHFHTLIRASDGSLAGSMHLPGYNRNVRVHAPREFILLSAKQQNHFMPDEIARFMKLQQEYLDTLVYRHPDGRAYPLAESRNEASTYQLFTLLNVMLIERDPKTNIARRLGIGEVFLKKWVAARPEFKTIILQ
ncbi:HET-domain-containing protein [Aspergillus heteromorphus CBS 117.55]|uniref:HET-domain-containing protein n=1 Tax=Aspergillus heteromorphus CBS 117.55 TaxID=1448321 RepID=A0A317W9X5_9EURO|nr:HET-domain-containing protein [Aspergillus heteromorphus CBS 117.55]PWY82122.1 HET-domain-containing protein [Aspergillus heteromorphus CBS 117.55]